MSVVYDVLLPLDKLVHMLAPEKTRKRVQETYRFVNDSTETRNPQQPYTTDLINPETLATEHSFAQSLALVVSYNTLGTS